MPHLFQRRDWFGNSPAVWILAAMLFVTPVAWWSLQQLRVEHGVERWLPADDPEVQSAEWVRRQFSTDDRLIVSWDGSALGDPRVQKLRDKLEPVRDAAGVRRGGLPQVADVIVPHDLLDAMQREGVAPQEAARRLQGTLLGVGPLRVRLTIDGRWRARRLLHELPEQAQRELGLKLTVAEPTAELATLAGIPGVAGESEDPVDSIAPAVLNATGELQTDADVEHDLSITGPGLELGTPLVAKLVEWLQIQVVEPGVEDSPKLVESCFFVPGTPVALSVALSEAGLADRAEALRQIRRAASDVGIPADALHWAGTAVIDTALDEQTAHALWNPAFPMTQLQRRSSVGCAMLVAMLLAAAMLRNVRMATVVLFAAVFTAFVGLAIVPATGGTLQAGLEVLPALWLALTLASGMSVAEEWQRAAAINPKTAAAETCRKVLVPCALAALAVALGGAALSLSSLAPVRSFGFYAAIGALVSCALTVYGIPALLMFWREAAGSTAAVHQPAWRWLGRLLVQRPGCQAAAFVTLCCLAGGGLLSLRLDTGSPSLLGASSRVARDARPLENQLAGLTSLEAIVRFDGAAQDEADCFARLELVRTIEERLRRHPDVSGCLALPDFHPVSTPPDEDASVMAATRHHRQANQLQDRLRSGEANAATFYAVIDDHPAASGNQVPQPGDEVWRIGTHIRELSATKQARLLHDVHEIARDVLRFQPGANHTAAGGLPLALRTQQAAFDGLLLSALVAGCAVLLLLCTQFPHVAGGSVALLPCALPLIAAVGLGSLCGMPLDVGGLLALPVALGLAVDGVLRTSRTFRAGVEGGLSRADAVVDALEQTGPSLLRAAAIMACSVLTLAYAESPMASHCGVWLAVLTGATALGQTVLLPQLLASPLGALCASSPQQPPAALDGGTSAITTEPPLDVTLPPLDSAASIRLAAG